MPEPAFTLPGIRVHLPRNRCSRSPESVFTMLWNGCSPSAGICVHDAPEYAQKRLERFLRRRDRRWDSSWQPSLKKRKSAAPCSNISRTRDSIASRPRSICAISPGNLPVVSGSTKIRFRRPTWSASTASKANAHDEKKRYLQDPRVQAVVKSGNEGLPSESRVKPPMPAR